MYGVLLIAVGGLIAAGAHSIGVLGGPALFRLSEFLAVTVIFVGYLLSNRPAAQPAGAGAVRPAAG